jgi:Tfp pilus tip-associated adhesin PilY1
MFENIWRYGLRKNNKIQSWDEAEKPIFGSSSKGKNQD